MGKRLLVLCSMASMSFGEEYDDINNYPFFNALITIFAKIFKEIQATFFEQVRAIYISGTLSAMLTIAILIYASRKMKEARFEFPKDAIEILVFLIMISFVNYCLHNYENFAKILNYLEIPANEISRVVMDSTDKSISLDTNIQRTIGGKLDLLLKQIEETQKMMIGSSSSNFLSVTIDVVLKFLLWLVYAWFAFILIASISITYILTFLQVEFWKTFGVVMIPLIYFKVTRGMVIFWLKTIIALSLISSFMSIVAHLALISEQAILKTIGNDFQWEIEKGMGMSYSIIGAVIISKIILITFLKEIPTLINGMLGTNAGGSTGAFANSVAMGSIGVAGAGAGFGAFKGMMKGGSIAKDKLSSVVNSQAMQTASSNTINQANLAGNVKRNIASSKISRGLNNTGDKQ